MNAIVYFLIPFVSIALMLLGFGWKDYTAMLTGGLMMFIYGIDVLITPIADLTSMANLLYGGCLFAFGIYILLRSSIDLMSED